MAAPTSSFPTSPTTTTTSVVAVMDRLLGNCGLAEEERQCLRRLTPQGIAKLNADLIRGVDPEETMATFRSVFRASQNFRARIFAALPVDVQRTVAMEERARVVSTSELCYLVACRQVGLLKQLIHPETGSLPTNLDLSECGAIYLAEQLHQKAKVLFLSQSKTSAVRDVIACRLAPTTCPEDLSTPHFASTRFSHFVVYFSPIVSWFHDDDSTDPISISTEAANFLSTPKSTTTMTSTTSTATTTSGSGPHSDWSFEVLTEDPTCESLDTDKHRGILKLPSSTVSCRAGGQRSLKVHFATDVLLSDERRSPKMLTRKSKKLSLLPVQQQQQQPQELLATASLLPLPFVRTLTDDSLGLSPSSSAASEQCCQDLQTFQPRTVVGSKNPLSPPQQSLPTDPSSITAFISPKPQCGCKKLSMAVSGWLSRIGRAISA